MAGVRYFYGLQPRWTGWDRLFKVYVVGQSLAGAYLAGQVYDDASGTAQLVAPAGVLAPLMALWVRRLVRKRAEREARYESLAPGSAEFLAGDRRNFVLQSVDIERLVVSPQRALWTAGSPNAGSIRVLLWSGKRWRFILIGEQDVERVEESLVGAFGAGRVEGSTTKA